MPLAAAVSVKLVSVVSAIDFQLPLPVFRNTRYSSAPADAFHFTVTPPTSFAALTSTGAAMYVVLQPVSSYALV